jgi:hypothetical protein
MDTTMPNWWACPRWTPATPSNGSSPASSNEKYRDGELQKSTVYYKYLNDDRNYLSETKTT